MIRFDIFCFDFGIVLLTISTCFVDLPHLSPLIRNRPFSNTVQDTSGPVVCLLTCRCAPRASPVAPMPRPRASPPVTEFPPDKKTEIPAMIVALCCWLRPPVSGPPALRTQVDEWEHSAPRRFASVAVFLTAPAHTVTLCCFAEKTHTPFRLAARKALPGHSSIVDRKRSSDSGDPQSSHRGPASVLL